MVCLILNCFIFKKSGKHRQRLSGMYCNSFGNNPKNWQKWIAGNSKISSQQRQCPGVWETAYCVLDKRWITIIYKVQQSICKWEKTALKKRNTNCLVSTWRHVQHHWSPGKCKWKLHWDSISLQPDWSHSRQWLARTAGEDVEKMNPYTLLVGM